MKSLILSVSLILLATAGARADGRFALPALPGADDAGFTLAALPGFARAALPTTRALPGRRGPGRIVLVRGHPECHGRKYHRPGYVDNYDPDHFQYTPEYLKYGRAKQPSRREAIAIAEKRFPELVTPKVVEMLRLVNNLRRSRGLTQMRMEPRLMLAAKRENVDIARYALMQHTGTDCSQLKDRVWDAGYTWTKIAENLAGGNATATATLGQWTSSKRHLFQLTLPGMTEAGLAYDYNPHPPRDGIPIKHFWTLILARPDPWRDRRGLGDRFDDKLLQKDKRKHAANRQMTDKKKP
jgi:uncharacterized protein YkwD